MIDTRLKRLQCKLQDLGLDGLVVKSPENRRYLSGFTGSEGWLLVLETKPYLCVDFRYLQQAKYQAPGCEIIRLDTMWPNTIRQLVPSECRRLGFEGRLLTYEHWDKLAKTLPTIDLVPTFDLVESLRVQKDEKEQTIIRQAIALADEGADFLRSKLIPGRQEREVALDLECFLRQRGADGAAFPFIVASGSRGALPHGEASDKRLQLGDLVTVDFGAVYQGYHSDLTRTFSLGAPTSKQKAIYEIVLQAQQKAIATAGPGVPCAEVDKAARDIIAKAGYGDYFGHATGHGVGLSIHEEPRLSVNVDTILLPGMVVTVEPGIYLPGWGGVRIEDIILITHQGIEVLSQASKETFVL
ncbi:MAG: M24 family metallopeptidase [bacterium]|jgi:Xaa-Pro aminopeptidase